MALMILGLALFFGVHAVTMARDVRAGLIERFGAGAYKGLYSVISIIGFVLIVVGFIAYRRAGYIPVWDPPRWTAHVAMTLMIPATILLAIYLLPAGRLKTLVKHPMLTMIKVWALAHLIANGDLGSIILFGSFLVYAVVDRIAVKRRAGVALPSAGWNNNDWAAIGLGVVLHHAIVVYLHPILFGVPVLMPR